MGHLDYKSFSQRHRPHIQPLDATLFITYRLAGSIPQTTLRWYRARKEWIQTEFARVRRTTQENAILMEEWLTRLEEFKHEWFLKFEDILHKAAIGPKWLQDDAVAQIVSGGLHDLDDEAYRLDAYSIMSNHVHVVFQPLITERELQQYHNRKGHLDYKASEHPSLARIMQLLKGKSAKQCNEVLGRRGQFWEHESFDHVVRQKNFGKTIRYVLNNPVKVGLVNEWRDYRWNYCRSELSERF